MSEAMRHFVDSETEERYRVRLTPRERNSTLGVDMRLNALVFETPQGQWVGSVPVHYMVKLSPLMEDDLGELLHQALEKG